MRGAVALWLLACASACTGPELVVGELLTDAADADTADANDASPSGCTSDTVCEVGEPHCNLSTGRCVECLVTDHCAGQEHPLCNPATHLCVECLSSTDCGNNLFCQLPEGECEDTP